MVLADRLITMRMMMLKLIMMVMVMIRVAVSGERPRYFLCASSNSAAVHQNELLVDGTNGAIIATPFAAAHTRTFMLALLLLLLVMLIL